MFKLPSLAFISSLLLLSSTTQSFAQTCVDDDGDGWGWNGERSCQVQAANTCVDDDGDGWGWNGVSSCQVTSSAAATIQQGDCIDEDGDGWGWNGQGSCRVDSASEGSVTGSSATPVESQACIDSDGDGWGWGPSGSCRLESSGVTQSDSDSQQSGESETNNNQQNASLPRGRYNRQSDLIALHFDHGPDPDDGHAAAAGFVVHDTFDLPVVVVGGTTGVYSADRYLPASEGLMNKIWGQQWLDGHNRRQTSVEQAARRWVGALAAGGDVWIAEGGPSDFTAAVVRMLQQQYPEYNTRRRVHVVQHSVWNEDHALRADLNFVRNNTDYIRIEDGNHPNSTADLRKENGAAFVSQALSSSYRGVWRSAFDYLDPQDKLDFSDTVELLHILNIATSDIADPDGFARYFF